MKCKSDDNNDQSKREKGISKNGPERMEWRKDEMIGGPTGKQWKKLDMKIAHENKNGGLTAAGLANLWCSVGGGIGCKGGRHGGRGGHVLMGVTWEGGKG